MSQEVYYRPPSEADSHIVRVMTGCSHNKCTFCNTFRNVPCRILPFAEVAQAMEQDAAELGHLVGKVQSVYLEGGDPMLMKAERLLEIMAHARKVFPAVRRFACYATARQITRKNQEKLDSLAKAGLQTVFVGLESGSDAILKRVNKGCASADLIKAGLMLASARITLDVSMMLGIGGLTDSREHALSTAQILNAIQPGYVRIHTFVPRQGTELGADYLAGRFILPGPHAVMRELRLLVSRLTAPIYLISNHWSNFVGFKAQMPDARDNLLAYIDKHLEKPESAFRAVGLDTGRD